MNNLLFLLKICLRSLMQLGHGLSNTSLGRPCRVNSTNLQQSLDGSTAKAIIWKLSKQVKNNFWYVRLLPCKFLDWSEMVCFWHLGRPCSKLWAITAPSILVQRNWNKMQLVVHHAKYFLKIFQTDRTWSKILADPAEADPAVNVCRAQAQWIRVVWSLNNGVPTTLIAVYHPCNFSLIGQGQNFALGRPCSKLCSPAAQSIRKCKFSDMK